MRVIYVDTLFFVNLIVDYLIILTTAKVCSVHASRPRMAAGAVFGGIYAVLSVIGSLSFLALAPLKIAAAVGMTLIAFGGEKHILRMILVLLAVSAAFGGAVMAMSMISGGDITETVYTSISLKILLPAFSVTYAVLSLVFRRMGRNKKGGGVCVVALGMGEKSTVLRGLFDTGNGLTDPITGKAVIVAEIGAVRKMFDSRTRAILTDEALRNPVKTLEALDKAGLGRGFRFIPYSTVGVSSGILLAFRPDRVSIEGKNKNGTLVALAPNKVSDGGAYSALVGVA